MKTEAAVQQEIQLAAPGLGVTLFRNNVGAAKDATGRVIRFGLGNISAQMATHSKSADLVGLRHSDGRFVAVEVKREGWRFTDTSHEIAQRRFLDIIRERGGVAGFCQSVEDFKELIAR